MLAGDGSCCRTPAACVAEVLIAVVDGVAVAAAENFVARNF